MPDPLDRLADTVHSRLCEFGFSTPSTAVVQALLRTAYFASLKAEEGRFVRGSLTYANPAGPDFRPLRIRADYPALNKLGQRLPLTVETFVKIARAVDSWSGSIVVYGTRANNLFVWGIADQLVQRNIRLNREAKSGFSHPGILTISIDGVGDLSVYHGDCFLGGQRAQLLVTQEHDALHSAKVASRIMPAFAPAALGISRSVKGGTDVAKISALLFKAWADMVARLCIGLRRVGTGGALIITPRPILDRLQITHPFPYRRLGDSLILKVLDDYYTSLVEDQVWNAQSTGAIPYAMYRRLDLAEADRQDREDELSGAAKLVTSLAALDGAVVLDPTLAVIGFGTKIGNGPTVRAVYDGFDFARRGKAAKKVDLSRFGTRHISMLRYCRLDRAAVGIVISQDGHVRLIVSAGRSLTLWDQIKLLRHEDYAPQAAHREHARRRQKAHIREKRKLGYTSMPKTVSLLLKIAGS